MVIRDLIRIGEATRNREVWRSLDKSRIVSSLMEERKEDQRQGYRRLLKLLVMEQLEYCMQAWSPHLNHQAKQLQDTGFLFNVQVDH